MRFFYFAMLSLYFSISSSYAQSSDLGSWNVFNLKYIINDKMSVFGEAQIRSLQFYDDFHYYEYKGGFEFKALKNIRICGLMGMASFTAKEIQIEKEFEIIKNIFAN